MRSKCLLLSNGLQLVLGGTSGLLVLLDEGLQSIELALALRDSECAEMTMTIGAIRTE